MLGVTILGTSPKHLAALIFCMIPFFSFFTFLHTPNSWGSALTSRLPQPSKPWSSTAEAIQDTKDLADQHDIFDSTLEGGARIRQACMLFPSDDKSHEMGANVVYERSIRTHLRHAEKWGYPSHILREDIIGQGKWEKLVFGKLLYLQSIVIAEMTKPIGKRAEWIVWFDADTIILNDNIPWSMFLPPREDFSDIHFLGNKDWNGYNCGVFMMRINEWSVNFLTQAAAIPLLRPDIPLGVPFPNYEQDAMKWVLEQKGYKEHTVYQPRLWYNGFSNGAEGELEVNTGDLLIHFPGVAQKFPEMGHWLDIVENEPEKARIPLANMTLHDDIQDFWTLLRAAKQALHSATEAREEDSNVRQVFNQHPALGDDLAEAFEELERLVYDEPFQRKELEEATLLVNAALDRTFKVKAEADQREEERQKKAEAEEEKKIQEQKQKEEEEKRKEQEEEKQKQEAEEKEQQTKDKENQVLQQQQEARQKTKGAEDEQRRFNGTKYAKTAGKKRLHLVNIKGKKKSI